MAGRPTSYKPEYAKRVAHLAAAGLTDSEIAEEFGVDRKTLWRWGVQFPEFRHTLKAAKGEPDDRVEASLYKRAVGFEHDSVKVSFDKEGNPLYAPYREYVVPDVTAQIFWLKNRRRDQWRDKTEVDVAVTEQLAVRLNNARKRAKP